MTELPPELTLAVARMRERTRERYGEAVLELSVSGTRVGATVALPAQADELRSLFRQAWPEARLRVLVLTERRARLALYSEAVPLPIWRRPGLGSEPGRELVTQLLPGDPPAELLAVRDRQQLVRAPGQAVGWVPRGAGYRVGPNPRAGPASTGWDPSVVLEAALALLGRPYVWGGTGAPGLDCSGLAWRAFLRAGVALPRNSRAQRRAGARVGLAELAPADLVGAIHRGPRRTSHVAIALDREELVHACSELGVVRRETLAEFRQRYRILTVRRLPGALPPGR